MSHQRHSMRKYLPQPTNLNIDDSIPEYGAFTHLGNYQKSQVVFSKVQKALQTLPRKLEIGSLLGLWSEKESCGLVVICRSHQTRAPPVDHLLNYLTLLVGPLSQLHPKQAKMSAPASAAANDKAGGDLPDNEMRTELQEIQMQMNATTDESLESTRRMVNMLEESKDAGIRTLVMLDEQGEQLDNIEGKMDHMKEDMRETEQNLTAMEKCCGLCVCPWNKAKNFERGSDYNATWKASEDGKVNTDGPRITVGDQNTGPQGGFVTKITNDAREDEMEQNLQEVSGMIGNLRNMAIDMGNEIGTQNKQVDRINQKAESLDNRVQAANKRAHKILRNQ